MSNKDAMEHLNKAAYAAEHLRKQIELDNAIKFTIENLSAVVAEIDTTKSFTAGQVLDVVDALKSILTDHRISNTDANIITYQLDLIAGAIEGEDDE